MKTIKLTLFTQITYGLGGLTAVLLGCELYDIVINHIVFTLGYFAGIKGLSLFYSQCCVNHESKEKTDIDVAQKDHKETFNFEVSQLQKEEQCYKTRKTCPYDCKGLCKDS